MIVVTHATICNGFSRILIKLIDIYLSIVFSYWDKAITLVYHS